MLPGASAPGRGCQRIPKAPEGRRQIMAPRKTGRRPFGAQGCCRTRLPGRTQLTCLCPLRGMTALLQGGNGALLLPPAHIPQRPQLLISSSVNPAIAGWALAPVGEPAQNEAVQLLLDGEAAAGQILRLLGVGFQIEEIGTVGEGGVPLVQAVAVLPVRTETPIRPGACSEKTARRPRTPLAGQLAQILAVRALACEPRGAEEGGLEVERLHQPSMRRPGVRGARASGSSAARGSWFRRVRRGRTRIPCSPRFSPWSATTATTVFRSRPRLSRKSISRPTWRSR